MSFREGTIMTKIEYRLIFAAAIAMMATMIMLLGVMHGIIPSNVVRLPIQVVGMAAVAMFAALRFMQWLRLKNA